MQSTILVTHSDPRVLTQEEKQQYRTEKQVIRTLQNIANKSFDLMWMGYQLPPSLGSGIGLIIWIPISLVIGAVSLVAFIAQKAFESSWGKPVALQDKFEDWLNTDEKIWDQNLAKGWLDAETVANFKKWHQELKEHSNSLLAIRKEIETIETEIKSRGDEERKTIEAQHGVDLEALNKSFTSLDIDETTYLEKMNGLKEKLTSDLNEINKDLKERLSDFQRQKNELGEKILKVVPDYYRWRQEKIDKREYQESKKEKSLEEFKKQQNNSREVEYRKYCVDSGSISQRKPWLSWESIEMIEKRFAE